MIAVLTTLARASEADELLVASPVELTASDLGILLDADFRFVGGADRRVVDGDPPIRSVGGETRAAWTFERGSDQVKAEARAWGGPISAGIDGGFGHDSFLAIYRSVQVDNVLLIEPGATLRTTLPAEASWYVSALYVGRMLEVVCAGDETVLRGAIQAGASAQVSGGQVTLSGSSSNEQVQCALRLLGMKARPGHEASSLALGSAMPGDEDFVIDGDPRVIQVRYARVPRPAGTEAANYSIMLVDVSFPPRKPDGATWDVFDGPDISVWVKVDDQVVWRSPIAQDRFSTSYRAIAVPRIDAKESNLAFTVMDVDLSASDRAGRVTLDLSQLHDVPAEGETLELETTAGVKLKVLIVPIL
ncbi:MAG: hypothetical protein KC621_10720 [Myxococcales bacterium]|nr:hypothetical protein [Myxococcales bacterium]